MSYTRETATALRLITKFGKAVALNREAQGEYNPSTGGFATTTSTLSGVGVFLNYRKEEIDGTAIQSSDRKMLYSGDEPQIDDMYGNERIVNVIPLSPDDTAKIMFTCQLRK